LRKSRTEVASASTRFSSSVSEVKIGIASMSSSGVTRGGSAVSSVGKSSMATEDAGGIAKSRPADLQ
jgi:hypothetical protein